MLARSDGESFRVGRNAVRSEGGGVDGRQGARKGVCPRKTVVGQELGRKALAAVLARSRPGKRPGSR